MFLPVLSDMYLVCTSQPVHTHLHTPLPFCFRPSDDPSLPMLSYDHLIQLVGDSVPTLLQDPLPISFSGSRLEQQAFIFSAQPGGWESVPGGSSLLVRRRPPSACVLTRGRGELWSFHLLMRALPRRGALNL